MKKNMTEAWVFVKEENSKTRLIRKNIDIGNIMDNEVLVKPLYGCMEGNIVHALKMEPEDIFQIRGEKEVVLGNSGVVVIEQKGSKVKDLKVGDICIYFCNGQWDDFGYPKKITGYDKSGSLGVFGKRIKLNEKEVIKIPDNSKFSLQQWAAFSLKYITAWSNWKVAYNCWKSQMQEVSPEETYVFGWGGGVSYAELSLAKLYGCKCYLMTSQSERMRMLEENGITGVNRKQFGESNTDEKFLEYVMTQTEGKGVSIFVDNIGHSVYKLTLKSLGRQGVITTSGWKSGGMLPILRPNECQGRHIHTFTHYATYEEGIEAMEFAINNDWMPEVSDKEYDWEDIPELLQKYSEGKISSYFPIYKINSL
ncbi:zinc-binding dehydrogenase [Bacillus mycoides]|uniref:zinc-binding dehydrogenase n=1 Tax=Bacillus mycoides TaxID=1405 RepID=UPI001879F265|nr:zinc-binding dehydrogenase [Bacillus mycoides]MBE7150861.1 zinc-binding dehydrogenase [Bacillus mycoides]